ncbi:unnamed protein product [Rotaria sordida]|uniref:TRPM-like domain-containing protein n=1 Tax=Rotaria sordida TaxID=392033 RepID=A0A819L790_9BILA|nr:unnamed protein product [Rotaria sordida]
MDRLYLTIFFCSQTENTIVASLLISKVYQIAGESEKNSEKKLIYRKREKIFDEHATIIMNRCFNINEDAAIQILTSPSELYFNYSPLELAEDNGSHSFLGTKCVQTYLDRQWSGAIIYKTQSSIWIRTLQAKDLLIFPIFILIFLMAYSITSYSLMATKNQIEQNSGNMSHINNSNITNNQIMEINEPSIIDEITQNNITNNHSLMFTVKKKNKIDLEFLQMIPIHVRNIIDWGMWKVYGQVEILDQKTADGITLNADNDAYGNTTFILTIVFVCISNLLLLNVLVALFKMNVKYKFELKLYLAIIYGPLLINNKLNWTIHNMITFNSKDQVKLNGIINKVSIHFSTVPTAQEPEIWLFVMKSGIKPNEFDIVRYQQLKEVKRKTGIQIFTDLNMQIDKDQYLAIRFSSEAGNPITLEGNQYYSYFDFGHHLARTIPFTICKNKRIAMNFQVLPNGYVSLNNNKSRSNKYKKKSSQRKRKSTNYKPTRVLIRCYNYHVINTQYRIDI